MKCFLPDDVLMDYKRLVLDRQIDTSSAAQIMKQCPVGVALPEAAFTLVKNADAECYQIDRAFWDSLPTWDWMEIFKANGVELPDVVEIKRQNRKARKEITDAGDQVPDNSTGITPWVY